MIQIAIACLAATNSIDDPLDDFDWVLIGDPGNPGYVEMDPFHMVQGRGRVVHLYRISRLEVTTAQWMEFVNSYSTRSNEWSTFAKPTFWGADWDLSWDGPGILWKLKDHPNAAMRPVVGVSWRECAMFCNWLHNGKGTSVRAIADGAYDTSTFGPFIPGEGYPDQNAHHPDARYWIPTLDEWLKAAHWDPDKHGNGQGGWWNYVHMRDDRPPRAGLPGEGETSANVELNDWAHWDIPLASYPDTQSPWGLVDLSGGAGEWIEDWLPKEHYPITDNRFWDGQPAGEEFDPPYEHWLEPIWTPAAHLPGSTLHLSFRVASVANACPADRNEDSLFNLLDVVSFQEAFLGGKWEADINADGTLDILDFVSFQASMTSGCPTP